jgi:hypothetical protein
VRVGRNLLQVYLPPVRNLPPIEEAGILEGRNGIKESILQQVKSVHISAAPRTSLSPLPTTLFLNTAWLRLFTQCLRHLSKKEWVVQEHLKPIEKTAVPVIMMRARCAPDPEHVIPLHALTNTVESALLYGAAAGLSTSPAHLVTIANAVSVRADHVIDTKFGASPLLSRPFPPPFPTRSLYTPRKVFKGRESSERLRCE